MRLQIMLNKEQYVLRHGDLGLHFCNTTYLILTHAGKYFQVCILFIIFCLMNNSGFLKSKKFYFHGIQVITGNKTHFLKFLLIALSQISYVYHTSLLSVSYAEGSLVLQIFVSIKLEIFKHLYLYISLYRNTKSPSTISID